MARLTSALAYKAPVVDDGGLPPDERHLHTAIGAEIKAWKHWLEVSDKSADTIFHYERAVAKLARMYPELPLKKFSDSHVLAVTKTWQPAGRGARVAGLNSFFGWAKLTRRIRENPMEFLPKLRKPKRKHIDIFTEAEVDDLLALPQQDAVLMAIMLGAGLRASECCNLQVRRLKVADDPARIIVLGGKGDKDRVVHPFPEKAEIIREFLLMNELEPTDHLWYGKPGGRRVISRRDPISYTSFLRWWDRCLYDARVRDEGRKNPHLARHTFATEWLRRGGRVEVLKEELGHESIQTTVDLYVHLDERDVLLDLVTIAENAPERRG